MAEVIELKLSDEPKPTMASIGSPAPTSMASGSVAEPLVHRALAGLDHHEHGNGRQLRIVVCGATGYLGRFVCKVAKERGFYVRALVRATGRLGEQEQYCDDVFVGQATQPETLGGLCESMDIVFSSIGIRNATRVPTPLEVDYAANINVMEEAAKAGVKHSIFVSVLHGKELRSKVGHVIEAREKVVDHLAAKAKEGGMTYTIMRPTGFFNDMAEVFKMAREGQAWMVGDGSKKINPIHGMDLAGLIVDVAADYESFVGEELDVGGPDVFSFKQLLEMAIRVAERPQGTKPSSMPVWALNLASKIVKPVNSNLAGFIIFFSMMGLEDMTAEKIGSRRLEDFFRKLHIGEASDDGWVEVAVHSRGKLTLQFDVDERDFGRRFKWTFKSKRKDIALAAKFVDARTGEEIILKEPTVFTKSFRKQMSHSVPIDRAGEFFVTFDNSYSMFYKKDLTYKLEVI